MAHPDELKPGTNPAAVATSQRQKETGRKAGAEQLPERVSPVEVQLKLHQEETGRKAGTEQLPEWGSPVEVQLKLHQEETGKEAGAEKFPGWGTLRSLRTDASGEMRQMIIEAEMEETCGKRDGNGEEKQESCENGDKRPAGIAASREEWEDFAGAVEDKGDGHPVPADRGRCQHRRWEPGKLHSELREKRNLGRLGTPQALMLQQDGGPIGGVYRLHTALLHWPLSSAATMEVQGPDTT